MIYNVYKITNIVNGKFYIGCTSKTVEERFSKHVKSSKRISPKLLLHRDMRELGIDKFIYETLYTGVSGFSVEKKMISEMNPDYNTIVGGTGGDYYSDKSEQEKLEIRKKQSESNIKNEVLKTLRTAERKLTDDEAREIKYTKGNDKYLKEKYKVSNGTIWKIKKGLRYKHV